MFIALNIYRTDEKGYLLLIKLTHINLAMFYETSANSAESDQMTQKGLFKKQTKIELHITNQQPLNSKWIHSIDKSGQFNLV